MDPREEDIFHLDIAHSLSRQGRYAGHSYRFLSIAEHCCHIHDLAPDHLKMQALMHDASETYLVDIPRPVKPYLIEYGPIEENIMQTIARKFKFSWPMDSYIKELDTNILLNEKDAIMNPCDQEWNMVGSTKLPISIQCWDPDTAKQQFLTRFYRLRDINHVA
jgi:hypothetical protein